MNTEMLAKIRASLIKHEALKLKPYLDSVGKITIGIGYNLSDRGMPIEWVNNQFVEDVDYLEVAFSHFPWWKQLNTDRQIVLIDMAFMGFKRFLGFVNLISALEKHDYHLAADAMLDSEWAEEVKNRAIQLAEGMRLGVYNI